MAFIVKEHRPGRIALLWLLVAVLWSVSIPATYWYSRADVERQVSDQTTRIEELRRQLDAATATHRNQEARMAILGRTAQIDREAKTGVTDQLKAEREKNAELREQVAFYKSIVSPEEGKSGLDVYSFKIARAADDLRHFKIVLIQAGKNSNVMEGRVDLVVEGTLGGRGKRLELTDVQVPGDELTEKLSYKFEYFQELSGGMRLPRGFVPREVVVKLINKGRRANTLTKKFDWSKLEV